MAGFGDQLRKWFGSKPSQKSAPRKSTKTHASSKSDRAALIADAMKIYRTQRAQGRGVLEKVLMDARVKPPAALFDRKGLERVLALRRAQLDLGQLFSHDLKRFLVLVGIRQWLGEGRASKAAPRS